jgi:hypothetical protein
MKVQFNFMFPRSLAQTPGQIKGLALSILPTPLPTSLILTAEATAKTEPYLTVSFSVDYPTADAAAQAIVNALNWQPIP